MAINIIAAMALVIGIYVLQQADKQKKPGQKTVYALTGLICLLWSLGVITGIYTANTAIMPLAFGLAAIGAVNSKGSTQAVFGAVAALIFLTFAF
jgi:hypothetical protein